MWDYDQPGGNRLLWAQFTREGGESQCGWLNDKYGVSWQIAHSIPGSLMKERARRVADAFTGMKKLDIEALIRA